MPATVPGLPPIPHDCQYAEQPDHDRHPPRRGLGDLVATDRDPRAQQRHQQQRRACHQQGGIHLGKPETGQRPPHPQPPPPTAMTPIVSGRGVTRPDRKVFAPAGDVPEPGQRLRRRGPGASDHESATPGRLILAGVSTAGNVLALATAVVSALGNAGGGPARRRGRHCPVAIDLSRDRGANLRSLR